MNQIHERMQTYGARTLSNAELLCLALFNHGGTENHLTRMQTLLTNAGGLQTLLRVDIGQFYQEYGLSKDKAVQLQAVLELARRFTLPQQDERYQIASPYDAARLLIPEMTYLDHEEMRVLCLDAKNYVIANMLLYQGTVDTSVFRVAELFRPAITRKLPVILICHNHPSGDTKPSDADLDFTQRCVEAGKVLNIQVLDHLIIGNNQFLSLKEHMRWTDG